METMLFHRTFSSYFAPLVFNLENNHFPVPPKDTSDGRATVRWRPSVVRHFLVKGRCALNHSRSC